MRWDREKLPKPVSHVYSENCAEITVYNMKRNPKKRRDGKKKQKKESLRNIIGKRKTQDY